MDLNRFEINVGQVNHHVPISWELTLQNTSAMPVEFLIYEVGKQDDSPSWLQLSQDEGVLENHLDTCTITLTFLTDIIKTHSTYLIIENKNNSGDMKIIRVNMEVVLSGKSAAKKLFNVLVDGSPIEQNNLLDLGEVFVGHMIRHRSIEIVNVSDVELEFHLTSNMSAESTTELHFSLSLTSLKSFHTLRVDPFGRTRVYVMYKPNYNKRGGFRSNSCPSSFVDEFQLYVKCRLVKDYQEVIILRAKCLPPQIDVPITDVLFIAKDTSHDSDATIEPESASITVSNLFDDPLLYIVRKDFCIYFTVETPPKCIIMGKEKHTITIKPNIARIFSSDDIFQQGKYIEEHLTIYNRKNMKEKWWISIRFTTGYLRQFFTAPGPKNAFTFSTLEESISLLLRQFKVLCDSTLNQIYSMMETSSNDSTKALKIRSISKMLKKSPFNTLYFDLRYLTDELVFYGLKGKAGQAFFDLAKLLYSILFSHKIFEMTKMIEEESGIRAVENVNATSEIMQEQNDFDDFSVPTGPNRVPLMLQKWGGQLSYFLSYFPDKKEELKVLWDINDALLSKH
jgi:hypothetical protein